MGIFIAKELGIDMGSSYTRMAAVGQGVVLCEPTVVAVSLENGLPAAAGIEAEALLRYAPDNYERICPVQDGVIQQQSLAVYILRTLLKKVSGKGRPIHKATFTMAGGRNERQYRAWEYCADLAGIRKAAFVEETVAAALAHGWDVYRPYGRMVVSLGGGQIRGSVLSYGDVAAHAASEAKGSGVEAMIIRHIEKQYGLKIGNGVAEGMKVALGAQGYTHQLPMQVTAQEQDGTAARALVYPAELSGVLLLQYNRVLEVIRQLFCSVSAEMVADIAEEGILLYGGNALLHGLQPYLAQQLQVPIHIAAQPLYAGAVGACAAIGADAARKQSR